MVQTTLLNTRPLKQGVALTQWCLEHHIECLNCPALEIVFKPLNEFESSQWDKLIFISANAVQGFVQSEAVQTQLSQIKNLPIYAIGRATACALSQQHLSPESLNQTQFDSEHFLQQAEFQDLRGQTLALIKGKGGRAVLAETLKQRGAKVLEYEVYQRQTASFCPQAWLNFKKAEQFSKPQVLLTSVESFKAILSNLTRLTSVEDVNWFKQQSAIVFSERIQQALLAEQWQGNIRVTATQSDDAVIQILTIFIRESSLCKGLTII